MGHTVGSGHREVLKTRAAGGSEGFGLASAGAADAADPGSEPMARALIIGGGHRGRCLASALRADAFTVRVIARDQAEMAEIAAVGAEGMVADPDRIGTLMDALPGIAVVCWLMGTVGDRWTALHGDRLRMLFEKLVDTPVRGLVYEGAGTLPPAAYVRGRRIAHAAARTWALPVEILDSDPTDLETWIAEARSAVALLLDPSRSEATPGRLGR
jgi:hypothetical protein